MTSTKPAVQGTSTLAGMRGRNAKGAKGKPVAINKFIETCEDLEKKGKYNELKHKTEKALRDEEYGEPAEDGRIYLLCAKSNYHLGYLIVAEHILYKFCDVHHDIHYKYAPKGEDEHSMQCKIHMEGDKLLGDVLF